MGLFSDITAALGSIFGNSSAPAPDPNDPLKKKQNTPTPTLTPLVSQKINLPVPLKASAPLNLGPRPIIPTVAPPVTNNLIAQPIPPPQPQGAGLFHDLTHNPVTNAIGTGAKDVGGAVGTGIPEAALRVGEGLVSSVADVPNIAIHAVTKTARMIGGPALPVLNSIDQQSQRV